LDGNDFGDGGSSIAGNTLGWLGGGDATDGGGGGDDREGGAGAQGMG